LLKITNACNFTVKSYSFITAVYLSSIICFLGKSQNFKRCLTLQKIFGIWIFYVAWNTVLVCGSIISQNFNLIGVSIWFKKYIFYMLNQDCLFLYQFVSPTYFLSLSLSPISHKDTLSLSLFILSMFVWLVCRPCPFTFQSTHVRERWEEQQGLIWQAERLTPRAQQFKKSLKLGADPAKLHFSSFSDFSS